MFETEQTAHFATAPNDDRKSAGVDGPRPASAATDQNHGYGIDNKSPVSVVRNSDPDAFVSCDRRCLTVRSLPPHYSRNALFQIGNDAVIQAPHSVSVKSMSLG